jgi:hypothetical protein
MRRMGERLNLPPPRGDQRSLAPQPSLPVLLFILMQFPLGCPLIGSEREPRANGLLPNSVLRAVTEAYREARANEILSTNQHEVRHAGTEQDEGNRISKPPPSATRPPLRTRSCRFLTRPTRTSFPDAALTSRSTAFCAAAGGANARSIAVAASQSRFMTNNIGQIVSFCMRLKVNQTLPHEASTKTGLHLSIAANSAKRPD